MEGKYKNNKTRCPKKAGGIWDIPAKVTACVVGCGESTVVAVRSGVRVDATTTGRKIRMADELLLEGATLLLSEVQKAINPEQTANLASADAPLIISK